jgi:hypothetical protein
MVALTAIGMIWTTTAHAAPIDGGVTAVYGNSNPTDPGRPTVPGYSGPGLEVRPDIEVTAVQTFRLGKVANYAFRIRNIGPGKAKSVTLHPEVSHDATSPAPYPLIPLGEMAPGAEKNIIITCTAQPGESPCLLAWVYAWLGDTEATRYGNDSNTSNNWEHSFPWA